MRKVVSIAITALLLALCAAPAPAQERLPVVATFSILADFVKNVGGDRVEVIALVGPDSDAHVYSPTPTDSRKLAGARLIVSNGLGFEGWIDRLAKASGTKAVHIVATDVIKPHSTVRGHSHDHSHGHGKFDPHAWQSVANALVYVANIRDGLIKADPAGKDVYTANASAYVARLNALDADIKAAMNAVPRDRRRIITTHNAFGYFGVAYGVDFVAPQGVSTESEASARDVARIITQIKRQKITAVFLENVSDERLMRRIAAESGARIGGKLYSDALSAGAPASTYIDMMRHNIKQLLGALVS